MKKTLIFILLMFLLSNKSYSADYYIVGIDAFKKGVYDKAASNLEHAVRINPKNVNARYYLAQTYLSQNRIFDAKNQYNRIIILAPTSDAARLSQLGLSLICQSYNNNEGLVSFDDMSRYKDNYLNYVLTGDGKILKWSSFPINVYIEPKKHKTTAIKAFEQWQEKSNNIAKFNFVSSPENAQIVLTFKTKLESTSNQDSYIAGYSKPYYQGNNISKSEINILSINPNTNEDLDDEYILFSTLHEIGHSLGFRGHSPNQNDVMAPSAVNPKIKLTQRDINTLISFYKTDEKMLLAKNKGQTDVQLQQALDYVKQMPTKAVGWSNLGDIYKNKKMYSNAIKNYKKAISIEPDKAETYNLIGSTYLEIQDSQNAFINLKKACDLDNTNSFYIYQFVKFCNDNGKKETGKSYLDKYLEKNPKAANDDKILNLKKMYK